MPSANPGPLLSICLTCRDGREADRDHRRGGSRLADAVTDEWERRGRPVDLRGVRCLSQCKRSCVISLTAPRAFTYIFGDLDPEDPSHVGAILDLVPLYRTAPEGFLARHERPEPLRASILGRLPWIGSEAEVVIDLGQSCDRLAARSGM